MTDLKLVHCMYPKCRDLVVGSIRSRHLADTHYFLCEEHARLVNLVAEDDIMTSGRFTRLCEDRSKEELLKKLFTEGY